MRPDGKRVKGLSPILAAMPYIMPKRYDAQNTITEYIDEEIIKQYIRQKRREGTRLDHMSVIIAAYYKAALKNPKINYFVMNRKIYERNHFCVSFVVLKKGADGGADQTTLKVYLEKNDNVYKIHDRIQQLVTVNTQATHSNSTDKFARFMLSLPVLPRFVLWLATVLDHHGLLPRFIVDLSPFHTSMFITNVASIKLNALHHHLYNFGTTTVFLGLGKKVTKFKMSKDGKITAKKYYPIACVTDERVAPGAIYGMAFQYLDKYLKNPELLEQPIDPAELRFDHKAEYTCTR